MVTALHTVRMSKPLRLPLKLSLLVYLLPSPLFVLPIILLPFVFLSFSGACEICRGYYCLLIEHIFLYAFCLPLGVLPLPSSILSFPSSHADCVEALRVCSADPRCEALYRGLELCAADAAVSPLGEQVAAECLERQDALLGKHPALSSCKCQRGLRKEEQCLHIYWSVRLMPGQSDRS